MDSFKRTHDGAEPSNMQPMKRSSATLSLLVSNEHAGAVIGPKGATLNAVRESTGCRCAVESTPTPEHERIVTLTATSVESAIAGIDAILTALFSAQSPPTGITFLVAPQCVGAVIGKNGSVINGLRTSTGCDIKVQNDSVRVLNTYARCDLLGEVKLILPAAQQVTSLLYEQYTKEGAPDIPDAKALLSLKHLNYHPPLPYQQHNIYQNTQPPMYGHGVPYESASIPLSPHAGAHTTLEMVIPSVYLGSLIGKGGKYFNAIRESFHGVELKVDSTTPLAHPGSGEPASTVTVIGSRDNVWAAAARCASSLLIGGSEDIPRAEMLYLDPASIPRIIGKSGSRINLIRSTSKCKITIDQPQPGAQVASCILEGRTKEILCARMLIEAREVASNHSNEQASHSQTHPVAPVTGHSTIELYIPKRYMGHMIGKSGKYINAARHATNCNIQVSEEPLTSQSSQEPMSTLCIMGASTMVWNAAAHMASYLLVGKQNPDEPDGVMSETLHIANDQVGHIIGKGGSRINVFRQASGCKITIEQDESGASGGLAVLTLEGSSRSVLAARILVTAREIKKNPELLNLPIDPSQPQVAPNMIQPALPNMMPHNAMLQPQQPMAFSAFSGGGGSQQLQGHIPMGMFGGY